MYIGNEEKMKKIANKVESISKKIETMMNNRLIISILMIVDGVFTIINPTEQMETNARIIAFTIMLAFIAMLTNNLRSKEKNKKSIIFSIIIIAICIYLLIFPTLLAINLVLLIAIFITSNALINIFNIIKLNKISLRIANAENKIKNKFEAGKNDKEFNQEIIIEKTERFASPFMNFVNKTSDNSVLYLILNIISVILGIVLLINHEITLVLCGIILIYTGLADLLMVAKTRRMSKMIK